MTLRGHVQRVEYNKLDYDTASAMVFYDLTNDCTITGADLSVVGAAIGTSVGSPSYNPRPDLDSDGSVNGADQSRIAGAIAQSCPRLVYDAGGSLTKVEGAKPAVYIGGIYEKDLGTGGVTKYYYADGKRIAMRKGGTLYYLANDHLDRTAVVMDASGGLVSRNRYHAYGMGWAQEGAPPTDRLYTGQRRFGPNSGMYYYNARFYGADVGRFLSPDSIVPGAGDPQARARGGVRGGSTRAASAALRTGL